jgi:hypothetical protein
MPGVQITTAVRTGPAVTGTAPDSTFFVVGQTERGTDSAAKLVTSLDEYEIYFGGYEANKYTYSTVRTFFEEGGANCYVSRASAAAGVKAYRDITVDGEAEGIKLTAVGKGTWGNGIQIVTTNDGGLMAFSLSYGGTEFFSASGLASIDELVSALENDTIAPNYVSVSLLAGTVGDEILGEVSPAGSLAGGTNGSIALTDYIAALGDFTEELGGGCVAIPGVATGTLGTDEDIYDALKAHAVQFNRISLCSFANGKTASEVRSTSSTYGASDNTGQEYLAFFYPWVQIPSGNGVTLTIPPEGYVAAVRSKTQNSTGSWKAYAGVDSSARFVTGIATAISKTTGDELDAARINALRVISNDIRIYGARSHSTTTAQWRFITAREVINYVVNQANIALEPLVFSTIDGRKTIYADITAALQSVLEPVRIAGGLYEGFSPTGKRLDYGYTIKVDDTLNPASQLESGLIKAQVGIRVSTIGDKITVNIVKSNLTTALV